MRLAFLAGLNAVLALGPVTTRAQEQTSPFRDRIDALRSATDPVETPPYEVVDPAYQAEISQDLAQIGAAFFPLFGAERRFVGHSTGAKGETAAITLFIGPDCASCPRALQELEALSSELGLRANVIDIAIPEDAALMARLSLDIVPSYVMPDRMIRGDMPVFVLERYLTAAR